MIISALIAISAAVSLPELARFGSRFARRAFPFSRALFGVWFRGFLRRLLAFALSFSFGRRSGAFLRPFHRRGVPVVAFVATGTFPKSYPLFAIIGLFVFRVLDALGRETRFDRLQTSFMLPISLVI